MMLATRAVSQSFHYNISVKNAAAHTLHVELLCNDLNGGIHDFKMPVWTPGYYQFLNFHENVSNLNIQDSDGNVYEYTNPQPNAWRLKTKAKTSYKISYDVRAARSFVATPYVDSARAYISPPGVFLHLAAFADKPVTVTVIAAPGWTDVATGLQPVAGKPFTYRAENFDVLYDSPILVGNLDSLPSFTVEGKLHRFSAYKPGEFDKVRFMDDLSRIVRTSAQIIGDIPYEDYTFIAIGPGGGGIEHLNSTTVSFNGKALNDSAGRIGMLHFLAHEYFHHYNVKRIRPVELGPFNYDKGSRTKMLWFSEGVTAYYEYLVVRRAGISSDSNLLNALQADILGYENKPGKSFQTLAQASYETWSDGPFGRTGDEINKTISYYQKGAIVGWLFDLAIRHATDNKRSLDDLMRTLYNKYYKEKKRGFTETEFRKEAESIAGTSLSELFDYVYTTKEINYNKYLGYAGLQADTATRIPDGGWLGINTRMRNDSLVVTTVEWNSPAYKAGIHSGTYLVSINGKPVQNVRALLPDAAAGSKMSVTVIEDGKQKSYDLVLANKSEQSFKVSRVANPDAAQQAIYRSWTGVNNN